MDENDGNFDPNSWDQNAELGKRLYGADEAQGYSTPSAPAAGCLIGISIAGGLILAGVIIWWVFSR